MLGKRDTTQAEQLQPNKQHVNVNLRWRIFMLNGSTWKPRCGNCWINVNSPLCVPVALYRTHSLVMTRIFGNIKSSFCPCCWSWPSNGLKLVLTNWRQRGFDADSRLGKGQKCCETTRHQNNSKRRSQETRLLDSRPSQVSNKIRTRQSVTSTVSTAELTLAKPRPITDGTVNTP